MILAFLRHTAAISSSEVYLPDDRRVLTEDGRTHAVALRPVLRRFAPDAVWCSPLRRAVETWTLAGTGLGLDARLHEDLGERSFPSLAGLTLPQIAARIGPAQTALARVSTDLVDPPGEESVRAASRRLVVAMRSVAREAAALGAERVLVVSHGGPSSWLLCHLLGVPLERNRVFRHDQGRFHLLEVDENLTLATAIALNTAQLPEPRGAPEPPGQFTAPPSWH
ncbi:histidine phosphatase family protein [Streptomyces griseofuscus]|uniref:histidine phosphatase family protein n=1 Tax=Streptomyces TaxID=1883 RepID=UPI0011887C9F|nr:histidine phosphatase family protein [Streptomyces murinus]MBA9043370.1 broad specificity phosphatase PhoE [Streptomyces murinus]BBC98551.1 histidine phosphatase family protein [Streptomyces rochei]